MKFKTTILCLLVLLSYTEGKSQSKKEEKEKLYSYVNKKVKIVSDKKSKIVLSAKCKAGIGMNNIPSFIITDLIAPYIFNNISKLFYNPNKYIKEHSKSYHLFKKDHIENIDQIKCLEYKKMNGKKEALKLNFELNSFKKDTRFKLISLNSIQYNYINVKLKPNNGYKINIVIEILINYYNNLGELKTLQLNTFSIDNLVPKGEESITKNPTGLYRFIPITNPIKSIHIKVTEVNARKKDWDTWLEVYNKNKDKIQSTVIEKISLD